MTETHATLKVSPDAPMTHDVGPADARLTGDETVDEVIEHHPGLRTTLMAYGLCTCCSGGLTLRQNAEAHGVPLSVILQDLEHELAKGA